MMTTEEIDMTIGDTITIEEDITMTEERDTREVDTVVITEVKEEIDTGRREAGTGTEDTGRMIRRPAPYLSRRSRWTGGSLERA